jgi:hypothetical protein
VRFDDAERVSVGIGEHDMGVAVVLTDVDVRRTDCQELDTVLAWSSSDAVREIEVNPVLAGLHVCDRPEQHVEAGGVRGHRLDVGPIGFSDVPPQCVGPAGGFFSQPNPNVMPMPPKGCVGLRSART